MINLLSEKPTKNLHGRLKFITTFVDERDIKDKCVLDIGCGYGWFELYALSKKPKKLVGTEISQKDLETIQKHIKNPLLTIRVGDATNLPFKNKLFDTVVSWDVLEHVKRGTDTNMFKEASRVIKTGGYFYLSTPYLSLFSTIFDPAWYLVSHRHYSMEKISKMASTNGFTIIKHQTKGGLWDILSTLTLYFSKWILKRTTIYENKLNAMVDLEYTGKGFVSLFVKLKKC